jgi:hypothetical protein
MIRPQSLAVTRIELLRDEKVLWPATGFIYRYGQTIALVSNWHVFSGINPLTKEVKGAPNAVSFHITIRDTGDAANGAIVSFRPETLPLCDEHKSLWWEHSYEEFKIDIGVLPLNELIPDFEQVKENIMSLPAQVFVSGKGDELFYTYGYPLAASEIFILGYPLGLAKQGLLPIWKRGSIASEPFFLTEDGPIVLVDALVRRGMSGSPVLYFGNEIATTEGVEVKEAKPSDPLLVGVYAGRDGVTPEEAEMALGRVWKKQLLDEIFYIRQPGPL